MTGRPAAGPGPGMVKVRLSGAVADTEVLACLLAYLAVHCDAGIDLIDVSPPYPNRREAGARLYLTVRLTADLAATGARPPHRATSRRQLATREEP